MDGAVVAGVGSAFVYQPLGKSFGGAVGDGTGVGRESVADRVLAPRIQDLDT